MKNLLYFGIILILASCGSNESESSATNESKSTASNDLSVNVNGREVSTVKIGNLEVMTEDLGVMEWPKAEQACESLGNGWRLPSLEELEILHKKRKRIGGFKVDHYWSSTESKDSNILNEMMIIVFGVGDQFYNGKQTPNCVRAVRTL